MTMRTTGRSKVSDYLSGKGSPFSTPFVLEQDTTENKHKVNEELKQTQKTIKNMIPFLRTNDDEYYM